jgi:hypothetical protein
MNEQPSFFRRNRTLVIIGVILAVVLCCCCVVGAFLAADPFGWNIFGSLKSLLNVGGDPVPASIPETAGIYMGVDLLNIKPEKITGIYKPFADALGQGSGNSSIDSTLKDLDQQFNEGIGMTLTDDVVPWVGRTAGLAILSIDPNNPEGQDLVLSVQSRNNKLADAFLQKLKGKLEEKNGVTFNEGSYKDVPIYSMPPRNGSMGVAFARSGDVVLLGLHESSIQESIDAQKSGSLSKDKTYQELVKQLPSDRLVTLYIGSSQAKAMYQSLLSASGSNSYGGLSPETTRALVMSSSIKPTARPSAFRLSTKA